MAIAKQGSVVTIKCPTCRRSFVPNVNQVKREQLIVCPHCKAHYMPAHSMDASAPSSQAQL